MEEEKKAKVIAMFAEMKAAANAERKQRRKQPRAIPAAGTSIINSTIVVCGPEMQSLVAQLLAQKQKHGNR